MINRKHIKGFTLIETVVTTGVFLMIMVGVYMMLLHYGDSTKTEQARIRLYQEGRFMQSVFANELKDAGAVLTLANTSMFLSKPIANFNGLYPLNSYTIDQKDTWPDGVIVAVGDPVATTKLREGKPYTPGDGVIYAESLNVSAYNPSYPFTNPQWSQGDKGIIIGEDGYYVFSVSSVDLAANTLSLRAEPVYYSGLLDIFNRYKDHEVTKGNAITYPAAGVVQAPVIRLASFSIYMFREITVVDGPNYRQLIRVIDTYGDNDPLADDSKAEFSIMSENIYDLQISYITWDKTTFPTIDRTTDVPDSNHYFAAGTTSQDFNSLMSDIRKKFLRQIDITLVVLTDEYGARGGERSTIDLEIPVIGDEGGYTILDAKYNFRILTFSILPRNFYHDSI